MNSGKFIITYTITEKNKKAKDKLEHKLTEIRVHLLPSEEHITVYCVEGETIRQVE